MSLPDRNGYPASLWRDTADEPASRPTLSDKKRHYDVAIVGGGYTGLSAALHLAQEGVGCVVLEGQRVGWGASGRNGGQVIAGLKQNPSELVAHFGTKMGERMTQTVGGSADVVFDLVDRYGLRCDAVRKGWIQAAHCERALERQKERANEWNALGADTHLLDASKVAVMTGARGYVGGWWDPRGGKVQPLAYALELARAAGEMGADIFEHSPVVSLEKHGDRWHLTTQQGSLTATQVILGTNGYTSPLWPSLEQSVVPAWSIQLSTVPLPSDVRSTLLPSGQSLSETRRILRYSHVDAHGRLVIGTQGPMRDKVTWRDARALAHDMERLFPQLEGVKFDHVWTGRVAMTLDHMPHLYHLADGLHAGLGYNGRGVAMATLMGRLLAMRAKNASEEDVGYPIQPLKAIPMHRFSGLGAEAYSYWYDLMDKLKL
ncbi:FAD-binding oxidoreductase [Acetobacter estunensis]|uniref:NAD(P)/FAD-dependent oxidoreductase n=1 Tax=Acetobacter estunensis TaxID=104097 RepID=UPI001C2D0869|nr:FAD-binding oxidoreductase [Acetobacter estunensis]MBV1837919.1 FAD-binding oxidoreductase [Acetobacter estunensis]